MVAPLPTAPKDFTPEQRRKWNLLIETLENRDRLYHQGLIGNGYTVSGTVPTTATIDLASIEVTATTRMLVKLIKDLRSQGILDVTLI